MTDKNTIDEVNVSKCKYFNNGWCLLSESCDDIRYRPCCDMTLFDCYYKNWQRKEQECEELKEKLILREVANIELSDEVKKYRKAIDEIEEIADNNYEIAEMEQIFLIIGGLDV